MLAMYVLFQSTVPTLTIATYSGIEYHKKDHMNTSTLNILEMLGLDAVEIIHRPRRADSTVGEPGRQPGADRCLSRWQLEARGEAKGRMAGRFRLAVR